MQRFNILSIDDQKIAELILLRTRKSFHPILFAILVCNFDIYGYNNSFFKRILLFKRYLIWYQ